MHIHTQKLPKNLPSKKRHFTPKTKKIQKWPPKIYPQKCDGPWENPNEIIIQKITQTLAGIFFDCRLALVFGRGITRWPFWAENGRAHFAVVGGVGLGGCCM